MDTFQFLPDHICISSMLLEILGDPVFHSIQTTDPCWTLARYPSAMAEIFSYGVDTDSELICDPSFTPA
jgi:hypothetical protein